MTPNFALSLSFEGIALLRRMGPRWALIDEVPLDHAEFDAQVISLRDKAEALDPSGAQVALVIPNEQIRYLDQLDLGGDDIARDVAIRAALDGATPYAVSELNFDHVVSGGRLHVAAVAKETLNEAHSFALEHGFEPVCFLATAPKGTFDGPVFFGKTSSWGRAVQRPSRAMEIFPADRAALQPLPKPELISTPDPAPLRKSAPAGAPATEPKLTVEPVQDLPTLLPLTPEAPAKPTAPEVKASPKPLSAERESEQPRQPGPAPKAPVAPPKPPADAKPLAAPTTSDRLAATKPAPAPGAAPEPSTPYAPEITPSQSSAAPEPERPVAFSTVRAGRSLPGGAAPAVTGGLKPRFTPVVPREAEKPEPAAPPTSGKTGFFAKPTATALLAQAAAAVDATEAALGGKASASAAAMPPTPKAPDLPPRLHAKAKPKAPTKPGLKALPKKAAVRAAGLAKAAPRAPIADDTLASPVAARKPVSGPKRTERPNPLAKLAALRGPRPQAQVGGPPLAAAAPAAPAHAMFESSNERDRMTVFGARDHDATGGKPRHLGLILTAVLLLFLAGVAAWASVFLDEGLARLFRSGDDAPASAIASLPDGADIPDASDAGVVLESAAPAAAASPAISLRPVARPAPDLRMAALDTPEVTAETPVAPLSVPIDPQQLTAAEAAATYAATGIWQRAPVKPMTPPADGVEDIYAASIDPNIQIFDAVALPDAKELEREPGLEDPGLPPPAGLTFDFDEREVVRATPEGALTPDGLRIFTGRPPVIPPLRGETPSVSPAADGPEAIRTRINTMPRIRPQARPSDIIEQRERSQLRGITRTELASIRPTMRPKTVQEQAEVDAPDATEQAIARSLVPVSRPRDMDAIVKQADRSLAPSPVQTVSAAAAPRTVAPKIPSSASVARSATLDNAINLKKINLIGVYGTSDNRRALVRLANGKYQKVKVGDRLDGGQVTAIGDEELRYSKGGRNLTLAMPRD